MKIIKEELEKIKKDGRSFLGIDGGSINSNVWFCGIEFGSDLQKMSDYYNSIVQLDNEIKGFDLPVPYRKKAGEFINSPYDRLLTIIYINFFKDDIIKSGANIKQRIDKVLEYELYNIDSKIFKFNLYPLGKKDTGWKKEITIKTGITKNEYYTTIYEKRKKFIREIIFKFNPKIIIATATNGMEEEFANAIINKNKILEYSFEYFKIEKSKKEFKISNYKSKNITLIVIPFLGRCNLNSYDDVIEIANHLRNKYLKSII